VEILDIRPPSPPPPPVPNDFAKIDANGDWEISIDEAREYFEGLGQRINLDTLWKVKDTDGDGYISWEEFQGPKGGKDDAPPPPPPKQMLNNQQKKKPTQQQHLQQQHPQQQQQHSEQGIATTRIAQKIDTDMDGKISKAELAAVFEGGGAKMTEELWKESDPDGNGYITYDEFFGSAGKISESKNKL
jgi:Ca2+-binding EF-hand superfamily protein